MPYYELRCENCRTEFNVKASIQERTEKNIRCPACASQDLETVYRKVNILRFKDKDCDVCPAPGAMSSGGCCGGQCRHGH
ncbi:MAG: FmdB family zinc ribbon protein [Bacillota bacterium]|nr:FmdB family zinc ribbon protein [Bacillota bacterium]